MKRQLGRRSFLLTMLSALTALVFTSTFAHGQIFHALDWSERFNNSAGTSDVQDNWVANSYTSTNGESVVSITFPIGDSFTNQPISALIYQGFDLMDPTAGGGLMLMGQKDTTLSGTPGIVTITFDSPIKFNAGDIFYAAVLMPGVPPNKFPFYNDANYASRMRSFFDTGLTFGGPYDIHQLPDNSANITPLGGSHPVVGPGIQSAGALALWVNSQ
jgi:hypothetical protein